jgi:methionyl-tRNA formyltransferase
LRVLFAGSPGIAAAALETLVRMEASGRVELAGLLTNPDSSRGRSGRREPTETAAAAMALEKGRSRGSIPVLKPERLDARAREAVSALNPDLLVSFAYGRIFGPRFLEIFPQGGLNIHPSLLPRYRGPAPIQAAILNRDRETGITIQRLALEMDAGDILAREAFPLTLRETAASLSETAALKGAALLEKLLSGELPPGRPQEGVPVYCSLMAKEDGLIDWGRSALDIDAQIRAFNPWPLCFTRRGETPLYILEALALEDAGDSSSPPGTVLGTDKARGILVQTGRGVLAVSRLQLPAKKALDWKSFLNGVRDFGASPLG